MRNMSDLSSFPQPTSQSPTTYTSRKQNASIYVSMGAICAFLSLIVVPEIFGSAAIILGAYAWRTEKEEQRNRGLVIIIAGIICLLVGIYFTSIFALIDLFPF
jgi:hypothetical protein